MNPPRVFRLEPDNERFVNFALVDDDLSHIFREFSGRPLRSSWRTPAIMVADSDDELAALADHALLGTIPVLSEAAVVELRDLLEPNGELLPLGYSRRSYFAYNVTTFVDALDETRSRLVRFSSGEVMIVDTFAWRQSALTGQSIFKIPQLPRASVFVTDSFAHRVRESELTGFVFQQV